jgi:hypothetical protein
MMMSNIASPWRYDGDTCRSIRSSITRLPAISRYAPWATGFRYRDRPAMPILHRDGSDANSKPDSTLWRCDERAAIS